MNHNTSSSKVSSGLRIQARLWHPISIGALALALAACGGGEDGAATTTLVTTPTTTIPVATTPPAPTTTTIVYVTQGAVVGVANASRINGAAARLTDRLAKVGFTTGAPTSYALGQLATTVIYYTSGDPASQAVAESLRLALGGGAITLAELTVPPPVDTGQLGNVTVLVAMGNDVADKTLAELQTGTTAPPATPAPTAAPVVTTPAAPATNPATTVPAG